MISWIQKYFQKHFRLVFLAVLIAIGVPMVVIYSAGGGGNGNNIKALERPFFNINLDSAEQNQRLTRDAELSVFLRVGYPALQGGQLRQYGLQRVAALALAEQLRLPAPTAEQVSKFVTTLRAFQTQEGQFDQSAYTRFGDQIKSGAIPFSMVDVNRILRDDAQVGSLTSLVAGPGYLLPSDVKLQLSRTDSTWTVQVASLDYNAFNPAINPSDDTLKKFQADNNYDVPARPRFSLVEFKAAEFLAPRPPTEAELRSFYNANIASFPVPADAADKKDAAAAATADNFPKVRAQVEAALNTAISRRLASEAASQLTVSLYEHRTTAPANSAALAQALAAQRRQVVPVAPFAPGYPPADKAWLVNYTDAIARLNQGDRFFSDPLPSPDGYIVLLWNENLPGYSPTFAEVRERVLADYKERERRRLFIERGQTLKSQLQAAARTPAGFAAKAAEEKLEVKSYANFTLRTAAPDFPRNALGALLQLESGQVSDMIGTEEGKGLLVFAQEKKLPDLTPANPRYAQTRDQFSAMLANNAENAVLGELVEQELKKTAPAAATP